MNRILFRALAQRAGTTTTAGRGALSCRSFHPEPRSFQNSAHGTHRFIYRWTIQAIGTPFAVAYLCDKISTKNDGGNSFEFGLPDIDTSLLTEPIKMRTQVWGQMRGF